MLRKVALEGQPPLQQPSNSPPRGMNQTPEHPNRTMCRFKPTQRHYSSATRSGKGFAHPTRGFPISAYQEEMSCSGIWTAPTQHHQEHASVLTAVSLHYMLRINSQDQDTASLICWMEISSRKTARTNQTGPSCDYFCKPMGLGA